MRSIGVGVIYFLLSTCVALAANVNFSGTVLAACSILATTGGTLALASDASTLGSGNIGGVAGTVTILSVGDSTIDVAAPTRTGQPAGYVSTGESIEVAYFGTGGLAVVNQAYTSSQTSFNVSTIPASIITVNNRLSNPNGFPAGNYSLQTVVTCAP